MKKRLISIIIIGIMIIGLTGCGIANKNSVDNMVKEADILDWEDVSKTVRDNGAKAEDYNDKLYIYTGEVYSIEEDYCQLEYTNPIMVYLDKETLKSLNKGDIITVVGTMKDVSDFPKLKDAIKLDKDTIKKYFIMDIVKKDGLSSLNMTYSDYEVDKNTGLVTSYKTKGSSNATHKLKYDNNGNLLEDSKEMVLYGTETITYTYNKDNTVDTQTESKTKDGKTEQGNVWKYTYEKDSKDRVTKKTGVNTTSDNQYTMVYTYEYGDDDKVIKETQTSPRSTYIINYEYDEFDNKVKEISYNIDKPTSKTTITNTYRIIAKK